MKQPTMRVVIGVAAAGAVLAGCTSSHHSAGAPASASVPATAPATTSAASTPASSAASSPAVSTSGSASGSVAASSAPPSLLCIEFCVCKSFCVAERCSKFCAVAGLPREPSSNGCRCGGPFA